jgi:pyroglutamyl-peptidase
MGSEGPSPVTVHVTGFKRFHGVAENPTERIVRGLQPFMETRGLPKGLVLGSCTVLEAAGQGALGPLYELLESTVSGRERQERVILVLSLSRPSRFTRSYISV